MSSRKKNALETKKANISQDNFLSKIDEFFAPHINIWFWTSFAVLLLLSLVFFDPKVSIGGDDSEYINRGFNFIKKGDFPGFQGPLYPIFLGLIIGVSGLNLVVLKAFSVIFMLVHFWLLFKVLKKYLPPSILVPVLLMLAVNASMLYYASSTYTESFFLMVQSFFLYVAEKYFIGNLKDSYNLKDDYGKFLAVGLAVFLMAITKNIGLTALIAMCLFFLLRKKWRATFYVVLAFAVFQLPFTAVKKYAFDANATQISNQGSAMLLKRHNDPSMGKEDFSGYINRIVVNSKEYLSKHFPLIYGLKSEANPQSSGFWTIIIYAILLTGFIILISKSDFWTFTGIYLIASCGLTFLALQTYWSQERLILIYTPLILIFIFFTFYYILKNYRPNLGWIFALVIAVFFMANTARTVRKIPGAITALSYYLSGNLLYGFTPDWINFFEMSEWAAQNLPEGSYVASRKPGMSFIASGGHDFYGMWNVPSDDPEELYQRLKDAGVTHVLMGSLRTVPSQKTNRIITTVRRYLTIIHSKYPDAIEFVHKIGEDESAYLYKIN